MQSNQKGQTVQIISNSPSCSFTWIENGNPGTIIQCNQVNTVYADGDFVGITLHNGLRYNIYYWENETNLGAISALDLVDKIQAIVDCAGSDGLSTSGQNYIVVPTVNTGDEIADKAANTAAAYQAILDAAALAINDGLTIANVLLMPGYYGQIIINADLGVFINITGMSGTARNGYGVYIDSLDLGANSQPCLVSNFCVDGNLKLPMDFLNTQTSIVSYLDNVQIKGQLKGNRESIIKNCSIGICSGEFADKLLICAGTIENTRIAEFAYTNFYGTIQKQCKIDSLNSGAGIILGYDGIPGILRDSIINSGSTGYAPIQDFVQNSVIRGCSLYGLTGNEAVMAVGEPRAGTVIMNDCDVNSSVSQTDLVSVNITLPNLGTLNLNIFH